jgi:hypothetical protein
MRRGTPLARIALAVGAGVAALALGACGDDDNDSGSSKSEAQALNVTLGADGKLTGVQSTESGLTKVTFNNQAKGKYDLQLVKVDGNQTVDQVLKITSREGPGPIPGWLHGAGGVGTIAGGTSSSSTQVLDGGKYYVLAEPDEGGKPVTAPLEVSGGKGSGTLPATTAKVTASEYTFKTSGLKAGNQQIEFDNAGAELHHAIFFPLKPGATLAQVKKFFQTEKGQPPFEVNKPIPSTPVLDTGGKQVIDTKLSPGKYAIVCFLTDRAGGPPHVAKGMITEVDVT